MVSYTTEMTEMNELSLTPHRMNRRKADFRFAYKFLEDEL